MSTPTDPQLDAALDETLLKLARFGAKYPEQIDATWEPIVEAKARLTAIVATAKIDALQQLEYAREKAKGPDAFISRYITEQVRSQKGKDV